MIHAKNLVFPSYSYLLVPVVMFFILAASCSKSDPLSPIDTPTEFVPKNVLFIGNSHTYFNNGVDTDLKGLLGHTNLSYTPNVQKIAVSGYTLEDHWNAPSTQNMLNLIDWDVLILQENSVRASTDVNSMLQYATMFHAKAKQLDAKVLLFMTWAFEDEPQMTGQLAANYNQIANQLNVETVPVGLGFQQFIEGNQELNLYNADGVHPSKEGTFLSACFFYKVIYDLEPNSVDYFGQLANEDANSIKTFSSSYFE